MSENKETIRIQDFYKEEFILNNIEKNYQNLLKLQVEPYIDCIVYQYYLNEIGGNNYTKGLLYDINSYIDKIESNINILKNFKNSEKNQELLIIKKKNADALQKKIKEMYEKYINKSQTEKYSVKFDIYNFHLTQINTSKIINKQIEDNNQIEILKKDMDRLEKLLNEEKDEIFIKLLENHIEIVEQQIETLK